MKNAYEVKGEETIIFVRRRDLPDLEVVVDTEDLERLLSFNVRWFSAKARELNSSRIYIKAIIGYRPNRTSIYLHRFLTDAPKGLEVDHDNGNTLDNRKLNLKVVPHYLNAQNIIKPDLHDVRGISYRKSESLWQVQLQVNHKRLRLGLYENYQDARNAAIEARRFYMPNSKEYRSFGPHPKIGSMTDDEFLEHIKLMYGGSMNHRISGWHASRPSCVICNTTDRRHRGLGLCTKCYSREYKSRSLAK